MVVVCKGMGVIGGIGRGVGVGVYKGGRVGSWLLRRRMREKRGKMGLGG